MVGVVVTLALAGCVGGPGGADTAQSGAAANASNVTSETLASIETVDRYAITGTTSIVERANNAERYRNVTLETVVDRQAGRVQSEQTVQLGPRSVAVDNYVVNGTFYQRSEANIRQFGAAWVKRDVAGNASQVRRQFDALRTHSDLLANGSATVTGTDTVDGTAVSLLTVDVNESALDAVSAPLGGDVSVERANVTYAIDQQTHEIRHVSGEQVATTAVRGQPVTVESRYNLTVEYENVGTISLPEAATAAVALGNRTAGTA